MAQKIIPHLWFDKQAKQAAEFYVSVFPNSKINSITSVHDTPSGDTDAVSFELDGQRFMAISAGPLFKFNESISFIVLCKDQKEIDYYWEKLSADPKAEQCGWLKDRFGLSWQVIPEALSELLSKDKSGRVIQAMLKMGKIEIAELQRAYRNN